MTLKAFRIDCDDYDMLVFAASRNRARRMVVESGPCDYEYPYVTARRHPSFDGFADAERLMLCNDDLPAGCPLFWSES